MPYNVAQSNWTDKPPTIQLIHGDTIDTVKTQSISIDDSVMDSNFSFGGAISKYIEIEFWNDLGITFYQGDKIGINILNEDEEGNLKDVGNSYSFKVYIDSIEELDRNVVKLKCYDALYYKLSKTFSFEEFKDYCSSKYKNSGYTDIVFCELDILKFIIYKVGPEYFDADLLNFTSLGIPAMHIERAVRLEGLTYMQILRDIAELSASGNSQQFIGDGSEGISFITSDFSNNSSDLYEYEIDTNDNIIESDIDFKNTFSICNFYYKGIKVNNDETYNSGAVRLYDYNFNPNNCILSVKTNKAASSYFSVSPNGKYGYYMKNRFVYGTIKTKINYMPRPGEIIKITKDTGVYYMIVSSIKHSNHTTTITGMNPDDHEESFNLKDVKSVSEVKVDEDTRYDFTYTTNGTSESNLTIKHPLSKYAKEMFVDDFEENTEISVDAKVGTTFYSNDSPGTYAQMETEMFLQWYLISAYDYSPSNEITAEVDWDDYGVLLGQSDIEKHSSQLGLDSIYRTFTLNFTTKFEGLDLSNLYKSSSNIANMYIVPVICINSKITNSNGSTITKQSTGYYKIASYSSIKYNTINFFQYPIYKEYSEIFDTGKYSYISSGSWPDTFRIYDKPEVVGEFTTSTIGGKTYIVSSGSVGVKNGKDILHIPLKYRNLSGRIEINISWYTECENNWDFGFLYLGTQKITPTATQVITQSSMGDGGRWLATMTGVQSLTISSKSIDLLTSGLRNKQLYLSVGYVKDSSGDTSNDRVCIESIEVVNKDSIYNDSLTPALYNATEQETYSAEDISDGSAILDEKEILTDIGILGGMGSTGFGTKNSKQGFYISVNTRYQLTFKALNTPVKISINKLSDVVENAYSYIYIGEEEIDPTYEEVKNQSKISEGYGEWIFTGTGSETEWQEIVWNNAGKIYPRIEKPLVLTLGTIRPSETSGTCQLWINEIKIDTWKETLN